MKITADGQVTIPEELREEFGLVPDTEVRFERDGDGLRLRRVVPAESTRGQRAVAALRAQAHAWNGMTTDELMELTRGPRDDAEGGR